jgi:hypothetical protein
MIKDELEDNPMQDKQPFYIKDCCKTFDPIFFKVNDS